MKLYYNRNLDKFVSKEKYFKAVFKGDFTDENTSNTIKRYNLKK